MKAIGAILVLFAVPAAAVWDPPYGPPLVVQEHNREPFHSEREHGDKDSSPATDNECNENHHLQPDGDGDCDDPKSIPEPGSLGLLALGLVALAARRRR